MFSLKQLQQQQVRDLAYSCFSEPIINDFTALTADDAPRHCGLGLTADRVDWLLQLDSDPGLLLDHLEKRRPSRLGFYHEALWHFFLRQDDEVELLASNQQIRQSGKTLGEFDVIYRDLNNGEHIHLELAYKFYLRAPHAATAELSEWLGPNVNDRLDLKLDHMLKHQCQLSSSQGGQDMLQTMGINHVVREISLRGCLLFAGQDDDQSGPVAPLNPDLQKGHWLPVSKTLPLLEQQEKWLALHRFNWISPLSSNPGTGLGKQEFADYLQDHFKHSSAAQMICALAERADGGTTEVCRIMVTADDWPKR